MSHIYIIAEAGVNHNGDPDLARSLVRAAKEAGADAVKFQTFSAENITTRTAPKAQYQKEQTDETESQFQMLKKLELSYDMHKELQELCSEEGIDFLSTPFDEDSVTLLESLNLPRYKIPSGEITNYPHLARIAQLKKPIILSTGMCTLNDVRQAVSVLNEHGATDITLLHCTTEYPAPYGEINLNAMATLRQEFGLNVGYSDHSEGIEIPIAAAALGATVIEKHFTMDRRLDGPDHKASLEPNELKAMVQGIRRVEQAMGSGRKQPTPSELRNTAIARKSIVASRRIALGEPFTEENLTAKRPGTGISPMNWNAVLGQKAKRTFEKDELIEL